MQCGAKIKNQDSISVISEVNKDLATGVSGTETIACFIDIFYHRTIWYFQKFCFHQP